MTASAVFHAGGDVGLEIVKEAIARNSDLQRSDTLIERGPIVGPTSIPYPATSAPSKQRRISHRAGHRPNRVERRGERNDSFATQQTCAGTKSDNSAQRRRTPNRAGRVGSNRGDAKPGRNRRRRTRRRSTRDALQVPGILHRTKGTDNTADAKRELVQVQLADDHCAGLLQLANQFSVFRGNPIAKLIAGRRGEDARGIEKVLQPDRNAVQRPSPVARHDFRFSLPRLLQSQAPR